MKPIHLNLAARPYRDYRPVYAVVVVVSLVTAFLMLNNVDAYYRYFHETKSTRTKIASIEAQTRQEREKQRIAERRLASLDLTRLQNQTKFVNAKLAERAFSWSALLDDLEAVLSDDVRLVTVSPSFADDGKVSLSLAFQSKSADGMVRTIDRMNHHPRFRDPFPSREGLIQGDLYAFDLTARYIPREPVTLRVASTLPDPKAAGKAAGGSEVKP